jgi:5'-nucleotidase
MERLVGRRPVLAGAGAVVASVGLGVPAYASEAARRPSPGELVDVQLLNITDFHGNNRTPTAQGDGFLPGADGQDTLHVGGAAYLATHLRGIRAARNSIFFSAGDNFGGGQPLDNKMLSDESTVEVLNALGLQFSALGNHEFDTGVDYLIDHMMKAKPIGVPGRDSSFPDSTGRPYQGIKFGYYSANILWRKSGRPVFAPYNVEWVTHGRRRYPIGFIHLTVADTSTASRPRWPATGPPPSSSAAACVRWWSWCTTARSRPTTGTRRSTARTSPLDRRSSSPRTSPRTSVRS